MLVTSLCHAQQQAASPAVQHKVQAIHPSSQVVHMKLPKSPWSEAKQREQQNVCMVSCCAAWRCGSVSRSAGGTLVVVYRSCVTCKAFGMNSSQASTASQFEQQTCAKHSSSRCSEVVVLVSPTTLQSTSRQVVGLGCWPPLALLAE